MPIDKLKARIDKGELQFDAAQAAAAERLGQLADELGKAQAAPAPKRGLFGRLKKTPEAPAAPKGLYIHGGVGRGKSMLMDLFFAAAPVAAKQRVHFHEFMLGVHRRLHALREAGDGAALDTLAEELAARHRLLCFDEFHVVNIADAMILGRLFEGLFARGVVVVATSNWPPRRLYENGLNRDRFLPFIELLCQRCDVVALEGPVDYRLGRLREHAVYHWPLGPAADEALESIFETLSDGEPGAPETIPVGQRSLVIPRAANGVAMLDFAALCEMPLGAADYLAITEHYHSVILKDIPLLTPDRRNEARRFMTLIDALYERRIMLFMSLEAEPSKLYPEGDGAFEFQRTVSRLMEMRSRDYLEGCRNRPIGPDAPPVNVFALTSDLT